MKPRARVRCSRILQRKMKKCEGFVFAFNYKLYSNVGKFRNVLTIACGYAIIEYHKKAGN